MVGDFDQFTMDSQLPPGKINRIDKSVMGLEMQFGGGGGTSHHHHQNPYDDRWIRTWTKDAERQKLYYHGRISKLERHKRSADYQRAKNLKLIKSLQHSRDTMKGRIGAFETRFDDQTAAFNVGLEGLRTAQGSLEAATSGIDSRLAGQSAQVDEQLRRAQENISDKLAAAEAGWDTERAAWEQQTADWTTQFAQQQRAIETQLATEKEEYRDQLKSIEDIYGLQTEEQRTAWEQQAAGQREMFSAQLEDIRTRDESEAQAWEQRFAQSQEQQRIADAIQNRDFEASLATLGNQFQEDWASKSQLLQSEYQNLIQQASTDAEKARLQQAQDFERMQLDQAAAYNKTSQELAAQDRVFETDIDALRRDLGIETDLLGSAQQEFAEKSEAERLRLSQSIGDLGQASAAARQQLASESEAARQELGAQLIGQQEDLRYDVSAQLGDFREDVQDYKASLDEQKQAQDEYYAANQRFREMQIQDAERARTAASYGSPGTALNQQVKGVRRAGSSQGLTRSKSPRNVFNRTGLRISSLNI